MSVLSKMKFLATWWWVGFATFPRTLVQAYNLTLKGLPWVPKPEPGDNTMPRRADATEIFLERIFAKYVLGLVEAYESPIVVRYRPAGIPGGRNASRRSRASHPVPPMLEFKILTPAFYSNLVYYSHDQ